MIYDVIHASGNWFGSHAGDDDLCPLTVGLGRERDSENLGFFDQEGKNAKKEEKYSDDSDDRCPSGSVLASNYDGVWPEPGEGNRRAGAIESSEEGLKDLIRGCWSSEKRRVVVGQGGCPPSSYEAAVGKPIA